MAADKTFLFVKKKLVGVSSKPAFFLFLCLGINTDRSIHPCAATAICDQAQLRTAAKQCQRKIEDLEAKCATLEKTIQKHMFSEHLIKDDDAATKFHTGFTSYTIFAMFLQQREEKAFSLTLWKGSETSPALNKPGPRRGVTWQLLINFSQFWLVFV